MKRTNQIATAALAAALCLAPAAVFAQASGTSSQGTTQPSSPQSQGTTEPSSPQTTGQQPSTTEPSTPGTAQTPPSTTGTQGTSSNQEEARQRLSAARTSLAELTKLPQATQLQGEQRTQVVNFISAFNTFATATTDWRSKYDTVDKQLDDLLSSADSNAAAPPSGTPSTTTPPGNTAGTPAAGESAALDPAIVGKLREVREHLDAFELAVGDPTFVAEAIEKVLDEAAGGGSGTVGTTGTPAAGGSITLSSDQVQQIRKQLAALREAVKK